MKSGLTFLLAFYGVLFSAFAHDPNLGAADANAEIPLGANYVITFILTADGTEQKADLITSRRGVRFDLVDNPEHSLRFKGQLKPEADGRVTLVYNAMLITVTTSPSRQVATTSGEGAIMLKCDQAMTIVRSDRQKLTVSVRPLSSPTPPPASTPTPPPA